MKRFTQISIVVILFLLLIIVMTIVNRLIEDKFNFGFSNWILSLIIVYQFNTFYKWIFNENL